MNAKKRVERIAAQIGAREQGPQTWADLIKWAADRADDRGRLSSTDHARLDDYWQRMKEQATGRTR